MAYTTINKSTDYFNTVLYTGTEPSNKAVTGVGFQPDFTWIKQRSGTEGHYLADVLRGSTKVIRSNENSVENDRGSNGIQSFDSDGFTAGGGDDINSNGGTFVSWNWKANGSGSSNTDGNITSTVSVNQTAGFSIVKYSGNSGGSGYSATIGHGLGVVPQVVIIKSLTQTGRFWAMFHEGNGNTGSQPLNHEQAFDVSNTYWYNTNPTSSVFTVGTNGDTNTVNHDYIAYCFANVTGYSKFGSYIGNGQSSDGSFIYTGFKPTFILTKDTSSTSWWVMHDTVRSTHNITSHVISSNEANAEASYTYYDILSNGFKARNGSSWVNTDGAKYIYLAFGQSLVGSNNVPCTAR